MTGQPFRQRWLVRAGRGDTCLMTSHQQSRAVEVAVSGGRMTSGMMRRGDRLLRPMGPWSPAVHEYLRLSGSSRFRRRAPGAGDRRRPGSPDLHRRRRRQSTRAGSRGTGTGSRPMRRTDLALRGAAKLIRKTAHGVRRLPASDHQLPFRPASARTGEIVSHGDLGPWNTVYRDGMPVAFIDWDAAQPVDPLADLAAAAQTFVPLAPPGLLAEAGFDPLPDLAARLRTFLDAYGLTDRTGDPARAAALRTGRGTIVALAPGHLAGPRPQTVTWHSRGFVQELLSEPAIAQAPIVRPGRTLRPRHRP